MHTIVSQDGRVVAHARSKEAAHRATRRAGRVGASVNRAGCDLQPGDPVYVRQVWAATGGGQEPLRHWFGDYEFVRYEGPRGPGFMETTGGSAIVRSTVGMYEGIETRWPVEDVRAAPGAARRPTKSLRTVNRAGGEHLYELRGFLKNTRGKWTRVKTLTIREKDPHSMAMQVWRISHSPGTPWRLEVRDLAAKRGKLAPLVTYEELVRRAGSELPGQSLNDDAPNRAEPATEVGVKRTGDGYWIWMNGAFRSMRFTTKKLSMSTIRRDVKAMTGLQRFTLRFRDESNRGGNRAGSAGTYVRRGDPTDRRARLRRGYEEDLARAEAAKKAGYTSGLSGGSIDDDIARLRRAVASLA